MSRILSSFVARMALGVNILIHGIVRLPKQDSFSAWMVDLYKDSMLPSSVVQLWSYAVPYIETTLGALVIIGLFTRQTLFALGLFLVALILGSCLIEKWEWAAFQMIYILFVCYLLQNVEHQRYTVDGFLARFKN